MEKYWAIAQSRVTSNYYIKEFEANTKIKAIKFAKKWCKEILGLLDYDLVVSKELIHCRHK